MDHDRQSGEGVTPQEYIGVKIEALEFADDAAKSLIQAQILTNPKNSTLSLPH